MMVEMEEREEMMPKTVLKVLLVEPDDSTRQILTALLRKCNYKVAAVADGLEAWEMLTRWHNSVDLILTELDLPSISGFALLTLITEHENCKNIPVVVTSAEDSMSMVLKCMLKGAADFLIKPVRKNELKNLWRHVWRRLAINGPRNLAIEQPKVDSTFGNHPATTHSDDNVSTSRKINNETTYNPNNVKIEKELALFTGCAEDLSRQYNNGDHVSVAVREDGNTSYTGITTEYQPSEESVPYRGRGAMDLIGCINDPNFNVVQTGSDREFSCLDHSTLDLQLSLKSLHDAETKVVDEMHPLNHSNSSAFSWFNSNEISHDPGLDQAAKRSNSAFHGENSTFLTSTSLNSDSVTHNSTVDRVSLERDGSSCSQIVDLSRCTNGSGMAVTSAVEKVVKHKSSNTLELDQFRHRTSIHSAEREAALARFRSKREGRCFEKKVRYQSRKKQAEQRPRVKGQFVRQSPY
ncbi:hypothetical protein RND81_01G208900 [Saponaria officinalis]|uniref:Uncharacterized protein n=1 Tax=Saponaria officinalis TaxID=3572 RepID=A0AAW1NGE3_SAPOF